MIRKGFVPGTVAALLCCAGALGAAPPLASSADIAAVASVVAPALPAEVRLPNSRQWNMRATGSDREYAIFVAVPDGPVPDSGYAVIYVLDGNAMFLTATEAVRAYARRRDAGRDARAIVVGIGYPEGSDFLRERGFDLTPDVHEERISGPTGGAEAFLNFIEHDLKPRIAREFRVDPQRQALMGHSYGGLFTLGVLARHHEAFQTYVGMSSSFWFGGHDLSNRVAAFAQARAKQATPVRVLLTVGEFEQRPAPDEWVRNPKRAAKMVRDLESRGQIKRAQEAARQLAQVPDLLVDFHEIPGEDHGSVIPAAIGRGVDFILGGPRMIPPVPDARDYLKMTAEARYHLRMEVRALPDPVRIPWLNTLKANLTRGLDEAQRKMLHEERQEMDRRFDSLPHAVNAD